VFDKGGVMSKLVDAVESRIVGKAIRDFPLLDVTKSVDKVPYDILDQHRIQIRWSGIFQCMPEEYPFLLKNFIRGFQEAIYGELRAKMIELRRAVYEQKREDLHRILEEMESVMFNI
jgi:hypothetical protein